MKKNNLSKWNQIYLWANVFNLLMASQTLKPQQTIKKYKILLQPAIM